MTQETAKELSGRVAIVTGAGRNIGRGIALALADGGAAVVVNASSNMAEAQGVAAEIERAGGKALAITADVAAWTSRIEAATAQINALKARENEARAELAKPVGILADRPAIDIAHLGERGWRIGDARRMRKACRRLSRVAREFDRVARGGPVRFPSEAAHAARHIGLEADAGLLAVVADINPSLDLAGDHLGGGGLDVPGKCGRVDRLARFHSEAEAVDSLPEARSGPGAGSVSPVTTVSDSLIPCSGFLDRRFGIP